MLLGQIVAISFATNLYFLTLLLSPPQQQPTAPSSNESGSKDPTSSSVSGYRKWFGPWLIDGLSVISTCGAADVLSWTKYQNGAPGFMQILLLPHVALMILPTARAILPARLFHPGHPTIVNKIYNFLWFLNAQFLGRLVWTTYQAYQAGNLGGIRDTLMEHPAVSSVGFDVIFSWLSWICWWQTQGDQTSFLSPKI